jgi:hypothetical protein
MIKDWLLHREPSGRHWRVYQSRNRHLFVSAGSDIYTIHIEAGPLAIMWESKGSRNDWGMK